MIYILHGEDTATSYDRLQELLAPLPEPLKIRLTKEHNWQDLNLAISSDDLFNPQKIIICEDFIKDQKVKTVHTDNLPPDLTVIFWERSQILQAQIAKIKNAQVEIFKPSPVLFWFLDSLSPGSLASTSKLLVKLQSPGLLFQLENRILLLILAKIGIDSQIVQKITGKAIASWQWSKIASQAQLFDLKKLYQLYSGVIKLESLIKTGKTNLDQNSLISILLLKYLQA